MAEMDEDFVDIQDKKKIFLLKEDIDMIRDNPEGLTKEGCEFHVKNWDASKNRYVKAKYRVMLAKCKNFTKSGKTVDGKTILARDKKGNIQWARLIEKESEAVAGD